jgi:hypothetical protein
LEIEKHDFHIPTAPTVAAGIQIKNQTTEDSNACRGKVEIEKHDSHFSTAPAACGARKEIFSASMAAQQASEYLQKGGLAAGRFAPASRLILQ